MTSEAKVELTAGGFSILVAQRNAKYDVQIYNTETRTQIGENGMPRAAAQALARALHAAIRSDDGASPNYL